MWQMIKLHGILFLANLIYAGNYTIAKEVMPAYVQPFGFIFLRVIMGSLLFWLVSSFWVKEPIRKKDFGQLALCGLLGVAINQLLFFKGLSITTPINASLLMVTTPILVLIASAVIIKESINGLKIVGIAAGAVGAVILIAYGNSVDLVRQTLPGDLMVFINACSYGMYLVLVKPLMKKYHPITIIKWVFTFGLIYVTPFGIEEFRAVAWDSLPGEIWLGIVYVVVGTTFMAYLLNMVALRQANPSIVGIYIYLQPLLASLIAIYYGKDQLTPIKILAMIIIFLGVYLVSRPSIREPKP